MAQQSAKMLDIEGKFTKEKKGLEKSLSDSILAIAKDTNDDLETLQERHTSRIAEIRASINEIETGFEYDKVERAEDTTRELTRAEEDYKHNREGMLAELAAAETEAEKARIQDRIDELDYEFNTKRQRKLEDQAEEDSDAEYAKNVRVKALQAQLAAEETEYDKQKKKRLADQTELENQPGRVTRSS